MGRLKGFASGVLMVFLVLVIEFTGHRVDAIYSGYTPEIIGFITFAMLLAVSYALKADRIALLTIFTVSAVYGYVAYLNKLEFYYHDYPESLSVFAPTIISRSVLYALPVFIGHVIAAMRAKRRMRSGNSLQ